MLTIFCVPKPFEGHVGTIQRNAIRSWTRLDPPCQVIVFGDEPGCADVASEFELEHIPDVRRNDIGTPLLSSVFRRAEEQATCDRLCYVNADLVLFPDFLAAAGRIAAARTRFLMVGQTTDLDVSGELAGDGLEALRRRALASGAVRGRDWIDYFVFPRGLMGAVPDFAVGRPYWDNWMIWRARTFRVPVVDVSPSTVVIHQAHGYGHVKDATGERWEGPEAEWNYRLVGVPELALFSLEEATHRLTATGLVRNDQRGLMHRAGTELLLHPRTIRGYRLLRATYEHARRALSRP